VSAWTKQKLGSAGQVVTGKTTPNGKSKVKMFLRGETVWLMQDKIAEGLEGSVSSILELTTADGKVHKTLDSMLLKAVAI